MSIIGSRWIDLVAEVGPGFAAKCAAHDEGDAFVADNYAVLKQRKAFSALVPPEFGGGGAARRALGAMEAEIAGATDLLLPGEPMHVVGYACTLRPATAAVIGVVHCAPRWTRPNVSPPPARSWSTAPA